MTQIAKFIICWIALSVYLPADPPLGDQADACLLGNRGEARRGGGLLRRIFHRRSGAESSGSNSGQTGVIFRFQPEPIAAPKEATFVAPK